MQIKIKEKKKKKKKKSACPAEKTRSLKGPEKLSIAPQRKQQMPECRVPRISKRENFQKNSVPNPLQEP